jgi:hypothetical protein
LAQKAATTTSPRRLFFIQRPAWAIHPGDVGFYSTRPQLHRLQFFPEGLPLLVEIIFRICERTTDLRE